MHTWSSDWKRVIIIVIIVRGDKVDHSSLALNMLARRCVFINHLIMIFVAFRWLASLKGLRNSVSIDINSLSKLGLTSCVN
jgi:hypothetical protein